MQGPNPTETANFTCSYTAEPMYSHFLRIVVRQTSCNEMHVFQKKGITKYKLYCKSRSEKKIWLSLQIY